MIWRKLAQIAIQQWSPGTIARMVDRGYFEPFPPEFTRRGRRYMRSLRREATPDDIEQSISGMKAA